MNGEKRMTSDAPTAAPSTAPLTPSLKDLPPKQRRFVTQYLSDQNATQAAIRAGYSKHTANEQGARLLAKVSPIVRPLLEAQERHLAEVSGINRERWLREVQRLAFFDVRRLFHEQTGKALDISSLPLDDVACISGFDVVEEFSRRGESREKIGCTKKVKLCDKLKALELFGKATGFYVERMEIHDKGPLADLSTAILLKMQAELSNRVRAVPVTLLPASAGGEKP